jgi:hypothetical protein
VSAVGDWLSHRIACSRFTEASLILKEVAKALGGDVKCHSRGENAYFATPPFGLLLTLVPDDLALQPYCSLFEANAPDPGEALKFDFLQAEQPPTLNQWAWFAHLAPGLATAYSVRRPPRPAAPYKWCVGRVLPAQRSCSDAADAAALAEALGVRIAADYLATHSILRQEIERG